jgi:trk system potassium uptake protein TrkH
MPRRETYFKSDLLFMNFALLSRLLGINSLLIGVTMVFSLPFALPAMGQHTLKPTAEGFEYKGVIGLILSMIISFAVGGLLYGYGRRAKDRLFRKEAMAVVGLSWILATILGALPFWLSGTSRGPAIRVLEEQQTPLVVNRDWQFWVEWTPLPSLQTGEQQKVLDAIHEAGAVGLTATELVRSTGLVDAVGVVNTIKSLGPQWDQNLLGPDEEDTGDRRTKNYRIRWVPMSLVDSLFESQSGFSTTGATVISDLEDPYLVPHCILFWRSSTHFLGGLGIIVLFVAVLGQGSAGKALMRTEMPGPTQEGSTERMQRTAWRFAGIYCVLTVVLAMVLMGCGMNLFDALCHSFGTMATGGFSTYNASLGAFAQTLGPGQGAAIEYVVTIFMMVAGTNFTLLYLMAILQPFKLANDIEWRTYLFFISLFSVLVIAFGLAMGDFPGFEQAFRYGLFQVVSIITTTGFGTDDFDQWNNFGRGALLLLMFVGGCAGSTGGGLKVIRHVLFLKILLLETERAYHPNVVRLLKLDGKSVEGQDLRRSILVYFGLIFFIFAFSWLAIITFESESTWGASHEHKLVDSASAVAATLNNIGPGLGTVGPTKNYGHFGELSKLLFVWLMMLGRLEIFPVLVLCIPGFWRNT